MGWVIPIPHLKGKRLKQGFKRFLLDCHVAGVFVWNGLVFSPIPHPRSRTRIATPPHHQCTNVVHPLAPPLCPHYHTTTPPLHQCGASLCPHYQRATMPMHQCGASLCPHYVSAPMWCIPHCGIGFHNAE